MSLRFCKKCGTLYDEKVIDCPKCTANRLVSSGESAREVARDMPKAEADALRKKSWIQLVIGIPALIGVLYLVGYLVRLIAN